MRAALHLKRDFVHPPTLIQWIEVQCSANHDGDNVSEREIMEVHVILKASLREHQSNVAVHNSIFRYYLMIAGKPQLRGVLGKVPELIEMMIEAFNSLKLLPASPVWGWELWGAWTNFSAGMPEMQIRMLKTPGFLECLLYGAEVQSVDGGCCRRFAALLRNLNENNDVGDEVLGVEAAKPLYKCLVLSLIRHRDAPRIVEVVCAAMCNMCMTNTMRSRFVELGPYLFGVLCMVIVHHVDNFEVVKQVASLISNICRGDNSFLPRQHLSEWDKACTRELSLSCADDLCYPRLSREALLEVDPSEWREFVPDAVYAWCRVHQPEPKLGMDSLLSYLLHNCIDEIPQSSQAYPAGVACIGALRNIFGGAGAEPLYKDVEPAVNILSTIVEWLRYLVEAQTGEDNSDQTTNFSNSNNSANNVNGIDVSATQFRAQGAESALAAARNYAAACPRFRRSIMMDREFQELVADAVAAFRGSIQVATQGCWLVHEIVRCRVLPCESWGAMMKAVRERYGDKSAAGRYATSVCAMVQVMSAGRVKAHTENPPKAFET